MSTIETHVDGAAAFKGAGAAGLFNGKLGRGPAEARAYPKLKPERAAAFANKRSRSKPASPASDEDSTHEEFLKRRDLLAGIARKNPKARLAAFLVALVHLKPDEGSGALVISEMTDARFVADLLSLSLEDLTLLLLQFKSDGLVAPMTGGAMRITNLAALERLADGQAYSKEAQVAESHRVIVEPPRIYTRFTAETATLTQHDGAVRFDVALLTSMACLVVAFGVALRIVGL